MSLDAEECSHPAGEISDLRIPSEGDPNNRGGQIAVNGTCKCGATVMLSATVTEVMEIER